MGDDTVPDEGFLFEHLRFHMEYNRDGRMALIGYTTWPVDMRVTPFMRYVGEYGYQFGYSLIEGRGPVPFNFFYTSNISIPRAMLSELDVVFEEDFSTYGWEDIELGYRLSARGMKLMFNKDAIARHYHPMDVKAFLKRQLCVGRASRVFLKKHPELAGFLGERSVLKKRAMFWPLANGLKGFLDFVDGRVGAPLPHLVYKAVLEAGYARGAVEQEGALV
jgi:GT2 family glycosyltransferase